MFFERPSHQSSQADHTHKSDAEPALLVHVDFPENTHGENDNRECQAEFYELVTSAGAQPVEWVTTKRTTPDAKTFVGRGKVEEMAEVVALHDVALVIFNHALSPSQERNLEKILQCRVLDRTGLILDIFAQRARTHEGKLQVELAQLQHQSTRLIRGWTHLERQKGGIGMRGPGETQLETDRRLLRGRMKAIQKRLEKVRAQRAQGRRARSRSSTPTVAIVGYTNAGKSTLFNALTNADVYAADQLFATLDPTLRKLEIPDLGDVVLADTVGFIRHLPHKLVEAFQATLQEAAEADLLLHVIDAAAPERDVNEYEVAKVLDDIGADQVRQIKVYNKIDLLDDIAPHIDSDDLGQPESVWLSAQDESGFGELKRAIAACLGGTMFAQEIVLTPSDAKLRALLFEAQAIVGEQYQDNGDSIVSVRLQEHDFKRLLARSEISEQRFFGEVKESWQ